MTQGVKSEHDVRGGCFANMGSRSFAFGAASIGLSSRTRQGVSTMSPGSRCRKVPTTRT